MDIISKGQRLPLSSLFAGASQAVQVGLDINGLETAVDFACFGLDAQQKLSDDRYMVFYNQPKTPCGSVELAVPAGDQTGFLCRLDRLPASIDRLVFTAAIDGNGTMRQIRSGHLRFLQEGRECARFAFAGPDFQDEKALMLGELYRKDGTWRFCATGQGFNGGLAALVRHFGGEVAEEASVPASTKLSLEKKMAADAPKLVDLAKKATVSLEKHRLQETIARVGLVLDASGSMSAQYSKGRVQEVIERLLPLAVHFDDDGELDVWAFSRKALALPPATLANYADYVNSAERGWRNWGMMSINNEPAVIEKVIAHYRNTRLPVLVIFVSDGGVSQNKEIKQLLIEAATLPIFWQFVGIGGRNYGVLEKLDTMAGRVVDNCGFFALDDLHGIDEQALYDRLLGEFPQWLEAARVKGIVH
ncbi:MULTISPECIES: VWA domain-containing protein [Methylomicrobium]|uniref:Putative stress response protein, TerZ-and CABP1 n=1 Tax=Methylomicrobium album BG8 TaxID=686340 RepID=H8GG75_METAL|nr:MULTISPECIES: VWA domain-containing protein [Methylomicrobium]EIC29999.1 putative stress response protein, TerZ- and CABP1 [Methylomicrobium album BG8]